MLFFTYRVHPIEFPNYELDCCKHDGVFLESRTHFITRIRDKFY